MKLVVDGTSKVIGAHMLGEHAPEIIQGIAIAIKAGATKDHFDETIGIHPTVGRRICNNEINFLFIDKIFNYYNVLHLFKGEDEMVNKFMAKLSYKTVPEYR